MKNKQEPFPLKKVIKGCTDRTSPQWEWAWRYLFSYYKNYLYTVILKTCDMFPQNSSTEKDQIVKDIFAELGLTLCKDEGRVLRSFRATESADAFRYYLAIITKRVARDFLIKQITESFTDKQMQKLENRGIDDSIFWELHEAIVEQIRKTRKKNDQNLERNILLYTLYHFEGFTSDMIAKQPLFKGIGDRVVDNVLHRIKIKLTNDKDFRE